MAENYRKLRGWILENAGLEAKSLPIAIQSLWMMDRERWEAYEREHTPNNLEEGVELVLSYLEATINGTAAQVAGPPAEECLLSPSPPAEGECLLVLPPQPKINVVVKANAQPTSAQQPLKLHLSGSSNQPGS
ncbi:UNVERIFIED_CONTAM: hypothetical protein FKN15_068283 [Acipenser sinensis]